MQIIVFLMMGFALLSFFSGTPGEAARDLATGRASGVAASLVAQHLAALHLCDGDGGKEICPVGRVVIEGRPGAGTARYVTRWDGENLITSWIPTPGDGTLPGLVTAELQRETSHSQFVGQFHTADGSVGFATTWDGGTPRTVVVPEGLRGGLEDQYPVYLTCTGRGDPCMH